MWWSIPRSWFTLPWPPAGGNDGEELRYKEMAERTFTFNVNVFTEIMMHASAPDLSPAYSANKHTISQISNALLQLRHCRRVENEPNIKLKHHLIETRGM